LRLDLSSSLPRGSWHCCHTPSGELSLSLHVAASCDRARHVTTDGDRPRHVATRRGLPRRSNDSGDPSQRAEISTRPVTARFRCYWWRFGKYHRNFWRRWDHLRHDRSLQKKAHCLISVAD
jgi:hypothetical protein